MNNDVLDATRVAHTVRDAFEDLIAQANLLPGALIVLGCSTSEIVGGRIGQNAQPELGRIVAETARATCAAHGIDLAVQCCEHLNRALVMERDVLRAHGFRQVMAVPFPHAGGSCGSAYYRLLRAPVLAEHIVADAGVDIGDTLIGMHIQHVAVPVKSRIRRVGQANLVMAYARPPYTGGPRAHYTLD